LTIQQHHTRGAITSSYIPTTALSSEAPR